MKAPQHYIDFENLIKEYFRNQDFKIIENNGNYLNQSYDLQVVKNTEKYLIELKFYRSRLIPLNIIRSSLNFLRTNLDLPEFSKYRGILIINSILSPKLIMEYYKNFGIEIWDRHYLAAKLSDASSELKEKFEQLLLETQQGTDSTPVLLEDNMNSKIIDFKELNINIKNSKSENDIGEKLCTELNKIECGKTGWSSYEQKSFEILKYLFEEDLSLWNKQCRTYDELSRFDLICRISSKDDFWKSLISSFQTRFILFEFKNYCNKINQDQIFSTERYLFTKALRSVAFIIARNDANENAIVAAKGSLREHGKLIIILNNEDLCNMLKLKDDGNSPNDYLADKLDNWLCSLSR